MQNKLQELTEKLYNEGLAKGKEAGERLLAEAQEQAQAIVSQARAEAAGLVAEAEKAAVALRAKAEADVRSASDQALQATRSDIEHLLTAGICTPGTDAALQDPAFLKEIILAVAQRFDATESADLSLILPEKLQAQLEPWVKGELSKALKHGVQASFSKKNTGGFSIGPKDGDWFVDLTDESFRNLIVSYLRPVTRKLLFGE